MDKQQQSRAPLIIAIVLLLLPVMYVGSYLASVSYHFEVHNADGSTERLVTYRADGEFIEVFFWPIEQIDKRIRPRALTSPDPFG
jgi:hypothetical protein